RKDKPVAIAMLADDVSQQDIHGAGLTVVKNADGRIVLKPDKGPDRTLKTAKADGFVGPKEAKVSAFAVKSKVFVRAKGDEAVLLCDAAAFELRRERQRQALRDRWTKEGLPGSVSFVHVFSGEMDLMLDHEAMRWGRSLKRGDKVTLAAAPDVAAVVKNVQAWRERTLVR